MSNRLTHTLIYFIIPITVQEGGLPQIFFFWIQGKWTRIQLYQRIPFFFNIVFSYTFIFKGKRTRIEYNQETFFYQEKRTSIQLYRGQIIFFFFEKLFFYFFIFLLSTKKYITFYFIFIFIFFSKFIYEIQILTFN